MGEYVPVKSHTGFTRCGACGQYQPDVQNGRCATCRQSPNGAQADDSRAVDFSTTKSEPTMTPLQQAAIDAIKEYGGLRAAGRALEVNHGIIGLARDGKDFPAAREALGLPPRTVEVPPEMVRKRAPAEPEDYRCRIAADVTPQQRAALHRLAAASGGWSAFVRRLANGDLRLEEA